MNSPHDLGYLTLRKIIGFLGILLPIGCVLFTNKSLPSISHYYYSDISVLFTGTLFVLGLFLLVTKGYSRDGEWLSDWTINSVAGICIIIVAFVPTDFIEDVNYGMEPMPVISYEGSFWPNLHFGSAVIFFLLMGSMFAFKFTRTEKGEDGKRIRATGSKWWMNLGYRICGYLIFSLLLIGGILFLFEGEETYTLPDRFVYWLEVFMLIPFAIAWFIKGQALQDISLGASKIKNTISSSFK